MGKSFGGTSIESEFSDVGKYCVISIGSYSDTSKYADQGIRVSYSEKVKDKILNKNDLTMVLNDKTSSGNIIGRVLYIETDDKYVYNQRTQRIQPFRELFDSKFLYHLLNVTKNRNKIIKQSQGNTQIYVNWSTISQTTYYYPAHISEQKHIRFFLDNLDDIITLHQCKRCAIDLSLR